MKIHKMYNREDYTTLEKIGIANIIQNFKKMTTLLRERDSPHLQVRNETKVNPTERYKVQFFIGVLGVVRGAKVFMNQRTSPYVVEGTRCNVHHQLDRLMIETRDKIS